MTPNEGFFKDYSWQERAIETLEEGLSDFYHRERGCFNHAFVLEVSPSGGKSIFALKAARTMIQADLIHKVFFIVPRESIKNGFQDDSRMVEMDESHRLLGQKTIRIDTGLKPVFTRFENYHGGVINYQSLAKFVDYFKMLTDLGNRLLFVFDEVHHGSASLEGSSVDDCENAWAKAMNEIRAIANAVICMTGTPVRTDRKAVPFFRYNPVVIDGEAVGHQVRADFCFAYKDAIEAGVARRSIFRPATPKVEFMNGEDYFHCDLNEVPRHLLDRAKRELFSSTNGHTDDMLQLASNENDLHRKAGDDEAAILVVVGNTDSRHNPLDHVATRIKTLFSETAVTVESSDTSSADAIKAFKKNVRNRWIVAKDMISEGTSIPRIRTVLILRDIQSRVKFEQTIHRATRNKSDISPQDAIILFYYLPEMVMFARKIEDSIRHIKSKPAIICPYCEKSLEFRPRQHKPCPYCNYEPKPSEQPRGPGTETPAQVSAAIAAAAAQSHHPGYRLNLEKWEYEHDPQIETMTPQEVSARVAEIVGVKHFPGQRFDRSTQTYTPDPVIVEQSTFGWISSQFKNELVIQSGEDFSKYDPTSRGFLASLGHRANALGRDIFNQVLAFADVQKVAPTEPDEALTIDEQIDHHWQAGLTNIRAAAAISAKRRNADVQKEIARLTSICKTDSGMGRQTIAMIRRDNPDPVKIVKAFEHYARQLLGRTR